MQGHAEPAFVLEHQAMETGRVDAGYGIARHDLTGGDVRRRIDRELQWDRQFRQIDVVAFEHHVFPCAAVDELAGNGLWAALTKRRGQIAGFHPETGGQQLAIAGDVRDQLHGAAAHVLEHDHRALAGVIELKHQRGGIETQVDRLANAQQFVRIFGLHQPQEAAQTLIVAVDISFHGCPLLSPQAASSIRGLGSARRLRAQSVPLGEESACTDRSITLERNSVSPREISMTRSRFLHVAAAAVAILAAPVAASGQAYPTRPIQVIVPFAGGSASDVVMRILLERMAKSIGQPFIVDNRPGAGGNIGTNAGTKAAPDGYTLVMGSTGPMAANRTLYRDLGYDPEKDLDPISLFAHFPILIVVSSKLPLKSLAEFVTYAKARPKQLNYGSVGIGSSQHLAGVYFEQVTGLELTHVPYRNIAQYVPDLSAAAGPVGFRGRPNAGAPLQSGDARALAVAASKRMTALPDVPTVAEAGIKNYEASGWLALLAPHGTPTPIIAKLNEELVAAVKDPQVRSKIIEQGAEGVSTTPEELAKFIASESVKWRNIIVKAGIPPIQ